MKFIIHILIIALGIFYPSFGMLSLKDQAIEIVAIKKIPYSSAQLPTEIRYEISAYQEMLTIKNANKNDYLKSITFAISTPTVSEKCFDFLLKKSKIDPKNIRINEDTVHYQFIAGQRAYPNYPETLLSAAAAANNVNAINVLCTQYGVPADHQQPHPLKWTPLFWAARNGHVNAIRALLYHGAQANQTDTGNSTPLHEAYNSEVVDILVKAGANINAQYAILDCTPLMQYLHFGLYYISDPDFKWRSISIEKIKKILEFPHHNFSLTDWRGRKALDIAREIKNPEVIQLVKQAIEKQTVVSKRKTNDIKNGIAFSSD